MQSKKKYLSPLLLLFVAIAAFWQVFFLQKGLKWDVIDSFLPARYFVSESLRSGIIPLWNPYLYLGTPSFGDMVSVWNPEVWVVSLFTTYSNITLQFIYIIYIFFAGIGMLKLLRHFKVNEYFSFAGGVVYMLSGFLIGNAQNLAAIAGAAWLPFVVLYYWKFLKDTSWKTLFPLLFFLFLMLFNGYPGLTIILIYLLGTFFIVELINKIKSKDSLTLFFKFHLYLVILMVLISSVLIISYFQVKPYIGQMAGVSLDWAMMHPFTPHSLISFFTPLASIKKPEFFNTDKSMTNIYLGIITLVFFILSLFFKRNRFIWIISGFGLIALLASVGDALPIRKFFFDYLPFMNVFRYPAFFRLFVIFPIVFTSFYYMETILSRKKYILISGLVIVLIPLLYLIVKSFPEVNFSNLSLHDSTLTYFNKLDKLSFKEAIFFQAIIQIVFLIFLGIILFLKKQKVLITVLIVLDMLVAVHLNSPFTVFSQKDPKELAAKLETLPKGYLTPDARELVYNTENSGQFSPVWRNTNLFQKRVSPYGFGSFILKNYAYLTDTFPDFSKAIFHHPFAYFTTQIKPENELGTSINKDDLFLKQIDYEYYKKLIKKVSQPDKINITFTDFSPVSMQFDINNNNPGFVCLLQNNFPNWKATVDGKHTPIITTNKSLMSIPLETGNHTIKINFSNPLIKIAFFFGMFVLLGCLLYYFFILHSETIVKYRILIIGLLVITLIFSIRGKYIDGQIINGRYNILGLAMKHLNEKFPDTKIEGVTEINNPNRLNTFCNESNINVKNHFIQLHYKNTWTQLYQIVDSSKSDYFFFANSYKPVYEEVLTCIRRKFPNPVYSISGKDVNFYCFSKKQPQKKNYQLNVSNYMEGFPEGWNNGSKTITEEKSFSWQKSALITKEDPYSPSYKFLFNNLDSGKTYFVTLSCQIYLTDDASGALVLSIYDNKTSTKYLWESEDLNNYFNQRNEWCYVSKSFKITNQYPQDLPLVLYVWNKGKSPIYVDDMNLTIRKSDE